MITVHVADNGTVKKLEDLRQQAKNPRALMLAIGRRIANTTKEHLRIKDANQPNKLGGKREHYFNRVAQSVQAPVTNADGTQVTVVINDPTFAQKVFGGRIEAVNAGALTIPQTPEAYGRRASVFEQETGMKLFLIHTSTGNAALAVIAENHQVKVEYILTPSVNQKPDPTALPSRELLQDTAIQQGEETLARQLQQGGLN